MSPPREICWKITPPIFGHRRPFSIATPRSRIASWVLAWIRDKSVLLCPLFCIVYRRRRFRSTLPIFRSYVVRHSFPSCILSRVCHVEFLAYCHCAPVLLVVASCSVAANSGTSRSVPLCWMPIAGCTSGTDANGNFPITRCAATVCYFPSE